MEVVAIDGCALFAQQHPRPRQAAGAGRHRDPRWPQASRREDWDNDQVIVQTIAPVLRDHERGARLVRIVRLTKFAEVRPVG